MSINVYRGNIITSESYDRLKVIPHGYVVVKNGFIEEVGESLSEPYVNEDIVDYGERLIIPAFSDLHMHAPQYTQRGIGMDCLLFDWLNNYTFPQEANFKDNAYAKSVYAKLVRDFLLHGSFHLALFTTIHYDACDILFRMLKESGLYAYAGITNMDRNSTDYYVDDTEESLRKTEEFIINHSDNERVRPILIPRFAPTCSNKLMAGLGELARKYDLGVHTHLVESKTEAAWAKELYPDCVSDGEIYEKYGLLQGSGPKIFAHVIFPSETEERILKEYHGISVHCPDSTSNVTAGIMPVSQMHEKGLEIALGSDVGGGHFLGIYHQVARATQISKMKEFYEEDYRRIHLANAFYMATVTGGSIFDRVGKIEKGYRFNVLVIDNMLDEEYQTSLEDALERFCYIGDDRNIYDRYIDGVRIDPEEVYERLSNMNI
ncbi:MAG: amidohydrolase family protein [Erysipelotrichaceae bacterium]|nr:amidohydrolase family protein [Erysipelotrichaceae bacterium]